MPIKDYRYPGEDAALRLSILGLTLVIFLVFTMSLGTAVVLVLIGILYVKLSQSRLFGNAMPVTDRSYPEVHRLLISSCKSLGVAMPSAHVVQDPRLNAYSLGTFAPFSVVLNSACVDELTREELHFIIGHEVGHILAGHTKWLSYIAPLGTTIPGFDLLFGFWQRKSEFTADRAGLLAVGNIEPSICALVKVSSGPRALEHVDVGEVLLQVEHLEPNDIGYQLGELLGTHPYMTSRIRELLLFDRKHHITQHGVEVCITCGAPVPPKSIFCIECGAQVACRECSARVEVPRSRFCTGCGNPLRSPTPREADIVH